MTRIGPYTLHTIEAGRFGLDGGAMFGIVPKALWARRMPPDEANRIPLHMRCLLLEDAERLILIDNGLGDKYDDKFASIFAVDDTTHNLTASLRQAGFDLDDVTDVLLTHLHFDHGGGSTRRRGDKLEVAFPNAQFHVQKRHWAWANEPNARERASFLQENLAPLAASGQLNLLEGPETPWPGLDLIIVDGHTEAQQLVKITGGAKTLVYVADLLPTHAHLPLPWIMAYDVRPLQTLQEKTRFLEQALAGGWSLFFEHDPEVVVGDLAETERGIGLANPRPLEEL